MINLFVRIGWSKDDVDLFEINEVFVMVIMFVMCKYGFDYVKVNVYGGVCVQGYLVGFIGLWIIFILINVLCQKGGKCGVVLLCIGGGEVIVVVFELF